MITRIKKLEKRTRPETGGILIYRQGPDGEKLTMQGEPLTPQDIKSAGLLIEWDPACDGI